MNLMFLHGSENKMNIPECLKRMLSFLWTLYNNVAKYFNKEEHLTLNFFHSFHIL